MATFHFELVSPERLVFSGEVDQVDVPGEEGEFGVFAGHAPYIATLKPGMLTIYGDSALGASASWCAAALPRSATGLTVLAERHAARSSTRPWSPRRSRTPKDIADAKSDARATRPASGWSSADAEQ